MPDPHFLAEIITLFYHILLTINLHPLPHVGTGLWQVRAWIKKSFRFFPVFKGHTKEAYSDLKVALRMEL